MAPDANSLARVWVYVHAESGSAFLTREPLDMSKSIDAGLCHEVGTTQERFAPQNQAQFNLFARAHGITNPHEFDFNPDLL